MDINIKLRNIMAFNDVAAMGDNCVSSHAPRVTRYRAGFLLTVLYLITTRKGYEELIKSSGHGTCKPDG